MWGIVPSLKRAGFIVGAKYGKGVVVCRTARGWSAPATIRGEGGKPRAFKSALVRRTWFFIVMNHHGVEGSDERQVHGGRRCQRNGGAGWPFRGSSNRRFDARGNSFVFQSARYFRRRFLLEGSTLPA